MQRLSRSRIILSRQSGTPKKEDDGLIHAVRGVSFELQKGDAIGIVGESGSGKTTTSRMIARLLDQSAGDIRYFGEDIGSQSIYRISTLKHKQIRSL